MHILIYLFCVLGLDVADVILSPEDQNIFEGQNVFFNCLLNGTNGRLIPVQWRFQMIESPTITINMNTTNYLILPPANSRLVIVHPSDGGTVTCSGGTREYSADFSIQRK